MEIVQLNNPELIREFITQPKLFDRLSEDNSASADDWVPNLNLSIWTAAIEPVSDDNATIYGMFAFVPETSIVYRFHPAINPEYWGNKLNVQAGKAALQWLWEHTTAQKVIAKAPSIYPDALRWGQRIGLKREGIQRKSFLKNGELHDQYYLGINRE